MPHQWGTRSRGLQPRAVITLAEKYCKKCGYENPEERGACLMCYTYLDEAATGTKCPDCGADNPKDAVFCSACGSQITDEIAGARPIALLAAAQLIWEAAGGETGEYEDDEDEYAPDEMSDEDREAFEEFQRQQAEIRGEAVPAEEEEYQPVMAATIDDESETSIAMSGIAEAFEEEELSMGESSEMDDSLAMDDDLDADEVPAPSVSASAEDIAVDEDAEITEDDLAMPIPGDLPGFTGSIAEPLFEDEEDAEPSTAPAEETPQAEEDEEDLGEWNLTFGDEE